jgi:hypothetical protein
LLLSRRSVGHEIGCLTVEGHEAPVPTDSCGGQGAIAARLLAI